MPSSPASAVRRTLPAATFEQLRALLQQTAQAIATPRPATVLTEAIVVTLNSSADFADLQFTLVVSEPFSALLQGKTVDAGADDSTNAPLDFSSPLYQIDLTFAPEAIASFLTRLGAVLSPTSEGQAFLTQLRQQLHSNDALLQSEFTLKLIDCLTATGPGAELYSAYPYVSVCQPVEEALRQQVEQERLLNQVITQVRQSLELPVILETAVQQVRHLLEADRLVIYQVSAHLTAAPHRSGSALNRLSNLKPGSGCITYEARSSPAIASVLNLVVDEQSLDPAYSEKYRQGYTLMVKDTEATYRLAPNLLNFLQRCQIRAKLAAPIVVQGELWGLLSAHQCTEPRDWQEREQTFLKRIAEHLAIAIDQAQLYAQLQQQKQTLEQQVIERTQELRDALIAAQSASRVRNDFLATMSHELRTPLTCVIGMSATLLRWSFGHLSDRQRHYLQTIHDSGEHLLALINDMLDLSQVEAGKAVLSVSEFSLTDLLTQSLEAFQEKAEATGITLELDLQIPEGHDSFTADRRRLKQVLVNLLSNAVKFTPEGGKVTLRSWLENTNAVLQVEDTGIGIPENQRPMLFQKFQQLDTSYQRKYEGTGLGLALTKQLVELHGGWIDVESKVGAGSIFTVQLPAQESGSASDTPKTMLNGNGSQGRIVLIDHQEESAMLICELLTAAGFQVVWLVEGATAVKQIGILHPVVVITDLQVPGMDGYEVMHYIRNTPTTQAIKILALASKAIAKSETHYLKAGADDYLEKPIDPEQLLNKVAGLIELAAYDTNSDYPGPSEP